MTLAVTGTNSKKQPWSAHHLELVCMMLADEFPEYAGNPWDLAFYGAARMNTVLIKNKAYIGGEKQNVGYRNLERLLQCEKQTGSPSIKTLDPIIVYFGLRPESRYNLFAAEVHDWLGFAHYINENFSHPAFSKSLPGTYDRAKSTCEEGEFKEWRQACSGYIVSDVLPALKAFGRKEQIPAAEKADAHEVGGPEKARTIEQAIQHQASRNPFFPSLEDFQADAVKLHAEKFDLTYHTFLHRPGPILFHGRWSTGKTVCALRMGMEFEKLGNSVRYIDFLENEIAAPNSSHGKDEEIIRKYKKLLEADQGDSATIFIFDNIHLFPEITNGLVRYAIQNKVNCIFIGRPFSYEFKKMDAYYPSKFSENVVDEDDMATVEEEVPAGARRPSITFGPDTSIIRQLFEQKLAAWNKLDQLTDEQLTAFAKAIGYNLSFAHFHIQQLKPESNNIYNIHYDGLYAFINDNYLLDQYTNELLAISALCYLDTKADATAIFTDQDRKNEFADSLQHLLRFKGEFFYGLHSAEARLIIDTAAMYGLIRAENNEICSTFNQALHAILERLFAGKPRNMYEIFLGLATYRSEEMAEDGRSAEEVSDIITYFLSEEKFSAYIAERIIRGTNRLIKFGLLCRMFVIFKVEKTALSRIFNEAMVHDFVSRFITFSNNRHQHFSFNWHLTYAWHSFKRLDQDLADYFLNQIPESMLIDFASYSIPQLSGFIEMAIYHPHIRSVLLNNADAIFGDTGKFQAKLKFAKELRFFFFIRFLYRLADRHPACNVLVNKMLDRMPPETYTLYVKQLEKKTLKSFYVARRYLDDPYVISLSNEFDDDFIYGLAFNKPLGKINEPFAKKYWDRFLNEELEKKMADASLQEIGCFIRNIVLHGFQQQCADDMIKLLSRKRVQRIIIQKMSEETVENSFIALWQLKSLNAGLFNEYIDEYYNSKDPDIDVLSFSSLWQAFLALILVHCYAENIDISDLVTKEELDIYLQRNFRSRRNDEKIFLIAIHYLVHSKIPAPAYRPDLKKTMVYLDDAMYYFMEDRDNIKVTQTTMVFWESKILRLAAILTALYEIDPDLFFNSRAGDDIRNYLFEAGELLTELSNDLPSDSVTLLKPHVVIQKNKTAILETLLLKTRDFQ